MGAIVVQKYGGSSVADVDKLKGVARRVVETAGRGKQLVVVVSAMGDTTDELLALARKVTPEPPRRELDMLLSVGERISMSLLSMAIHDLGYEAISFTGSQCGIITNDRHSGARIIEVRPYRIQDELERGRIVIVAGYQGVSYKREVTTLGRGGSDTTAVALAAALGAEYCEIYSDVDGVWSADPRVVPHPVKLDEVSYEEMQALAEHGAKVLNPQAVEWARRAKISIFARKTSGEGTGTLVAGAPREERVVGVAGQKGLVRLRLRLGAARAADLLGVLGADGVDIEAFHQPPGGGPTCVFGRDDLPDFGRLRERLEERFAEDLQVEEDLGAVTLVGWGAGADGKVTAQALSVARQDWVTLRGIETRPLCIILYCDSAQVDDLARALHHEFVESALLPGDDAGAEAASHPVEG
ncbi:MAG: aspartate kinase [Deltaproteobacteria bacterium]|nr:aspartate kinase [Deltaproteobacteria bacterium]